MARRLWTEQRRVTFLPCVPSILRLSSSASLNPATFRDWAKLFLPYCSADMHSGRRTTREPKLGGYFFAGHSLIAASLLHLANVSGYHEPQSVLVTVSAGGIGALLHADYFSRHFDDAIVKASPACGFFYAGVSSLRDWESNGNHAEQHLKLHSRMGSVIDEGCSNATGGDMAASYRRAPRIAHIQTPLDHGESYAIPPSSRIVVWTREASRRPTSSSGAPGCEGRSLPSPLAAATLPPADTLLLRV